MARDIDVSDKDLLQLNKDGYMVVDNMFKPFDLNILDMYFRVYGSKALSGETIPGVFHLCDLSEKIINFESLKILSNKIFKKPFYTGHSDLHRNIRSNWHRDDGDYEGNPGGYFERSLVGESGVKVVKVATYFEDDKYSGLHVKPGSHLTKNDDMIPSEFIQCGYPNAIVFDVRIRHKGVARASMANILSGKRTSLFFTIAENCNDAVKFSKNNFERQVSQSKFSLNREPIEFDVIN